MTLDDFVTAHSIDPSNLVIKIDTEGAERDILRQLAPWLERHRPSILLSWHVFAYLVSQSASQSVRNCRLLPVQARAPAASALVAVSRVLDV